MSLVAHEVRRYSSTSTESSTDRIDLGGDIQEVGNIPQETNGLAAVVSWFQQSRLPRRVLATSSPC